MGRSRKYITEEERKEAHRQSVRKWRETHRPEMNRAQQKKYDSGRAHEYYLKNRNRILERVKKYYFEHQEERRQYSREYYKLYGGS